jgi:hypothetical protein
MALTVNQNSGGSQSATGQSNLQAPGTGNPTSTVGGKVQPGTPTSQLTSGNGISLNPTPLTTVSLKSASSTSTPKPVAPKQQINPVLFGLAIGLFLVALALFWAIARSGKKHNQYT